MRTGDVVTGPHWRRWTGLALVLAAPVDLLVALMASVHAVYYLAIFLFVPLALCRTALAVGAAIRVWRPECPARWVWAGTLLHALAVAALLHGPLGQLLRGREPDIGPQVWLGTLLLCWPLLVVAVAGAALVRERRHGRVQIAR